MSRKTLRNKNHVADPARKSRCRRNRLARLKRGFSSRKEEHLEWQKYKLQLRRDREAAAREIIDEKEG